MPGALGGFEWCGHSSLTMMGYPLWQHPTSLAAPPHPDWWGHPCKMWQRSFNPIGLAAAAAVLLTYGITLYYWFFS